ncbi:MAG: hypothetical protein AB7W16_05270 [Candidatus Obscuribacterales bacterium]
MSKPTRIFLVEQDEPSLVMLNLWLDNFDDIEIVGTALADEDVLGRIALSRPDVVVFKWQTSTVKQLKMTMDAPALVCIRDGNFLALEGMINGTPEILIPSTHTCDELIKSIKRAAAKRLAMHSKPEMPLSKAG